MNPVTNKFSVIVRWDDTGAASNVGGPVETEYRIFEVEMPEVAAFFREHENSFSAITILGVAVTREASDE